jgi:hypothetical protein
MTPSEFMQLYRAMAIVMDDNTVHVADIHQYMINTATNSREHHAKQMWQQIKARLDDEVKGEKKEAKEWQQAHKVGPPPPASREWLVHQIDPTVTYGLLEAVHLGKGSPDANQVFIILAVRYGFADPHLLSQFTDKYMGLDCSGFVSNYLVHIGRLSRDAPMQRGAKSFDDFANRRDRLDEVRRFDLMVWSDTNHIAIINTAPVAQQQLLPSGHHHGRGQAQHPDPPRTRTVYTSDVVESNGSHGLHKGSYTLESVNDHQVFTVKRAGSSHPWHVYIVDYSITG